MGEFNCSPLRHADDRITGWVPLKKLKRNKLKKAKYTDERLGPLKVVPDFLPRPDKLAFGSAMKIRSVGADNRSFHITTYRGEFSFPFSKANPRPTTRDPINRLYVDPEIRNQGFTYILKSGKEGTVLVDQVLDFNRDPIYMRRAAAY